MFLSKRFSHRPTGQLPSKSSAKSPKRRPSSKSSPQRLRAFTKVTTKHSSYNMSMTWPVNCLTCLLHQECRYTFQPTLRTLSSCLTSSPGSSLYHLVLSEDITFLLGPHRSVLSLHPCSSGNNVNLKPHTQFAQEPGTM